MIDKLTEQNSQMACLLGQVTGALMMLPQLIPPTNLPAHMAIEKTMKMLHEDIAKIMYEEN